MKEVRPEFVPPNSNELDLGNIDKMFTRELPKETPEDVSVLTRKAKFDNFTYTNDKDSLLL